MNEELEREAFYEWEGQNEISPLEAWLERASRATSPQSGKRITEQMVAECVTKWFPDRAYQASFFARALFSMSDAETECVHTWISNSGRGGHPVFRPGRVSYYPIMHITCGKCNARTWVTEPEWKAKIEHGEGQS